jgi:uroporphyrin-III C-methyltransferase
MKTKNNFPRLSLIGAGPGDPELITVKALKALAQADVVLYDALANEVLLDYAPSKAKRIFVGKRKGKHSLTQDEINTLIVQTALQYGHVVRLKGGDPFVFGRGKEEADYAALFNIPYEYIPGISSAVSVPGLQGIPVTHRGSSESFWVLTGNTKKGTLSKDVELAAQTNATAVILMGTSKLKDIAKVYQKHNKGDVPVAVIYNGSQFSEAVAIGKIDTIAETAQQLNNKGPGIIVIGEVVKHHPDYAVLLREFGQFLN